MNNLSNKFLIFLKSNFYKLFFFSYFCTGIIIFKDYGISVDEEFHRFSGFYWLNYLLSFFNFKILNNLVSFKLSEINGFTLPNPKDYPFYGVAFDLPLALIETIFNFKTYKDIFYLRHFANFLIFFVSSIYFYKILSNRFKNNFIIFCGLFFYIISPRIFGHSFYNNKDIILLSFVTISIFYYFKTIDNFNLKNILFFSLFSALSCSTRVVAIFIPLSFLLFYFFSLLNKKIIKDQTLKIIFYIIFFIFFTILTWPYLWSNPINNFINSIKVFSKYSLTIQMLFNGHYIHSNILPLIYLPVWIFITTPIINLIFFLFAFFYYLKRSFFRMINIKPVSIYEDFWRGNKEKKDFFIFFNFFIVFIYLTLSDVTLYTGWRQVYFLHFFLAYMSTFGLYLFLNFTKNRKIKFITYALVAIFLFSNIATLIRFHPYQSLYFNSILNEKQKNLFEVDYWGLSGVKFLKKILTLEKNNNNKINVATASFLPLERSIKLLDENETLRINIVGQEYNKAEYIFDANISEVNKFLNKKYDIPKNFKKIDEFKIDNIIIYKIYKKF